MKAVITVIGKNKVGIMAGITTILAMHHISILDISQTIMQEYFTMIMIVDISKINISFKDIKKELEEKGQELGVTIRIQHEEIFDSMHHL